MNDPNEHPDGGPDPSTPGGEHSPAPDASGSASGDPPLASNVDLDAVEGDLDGVETALGRLDDGTYWTDEVTGEEIPDDVLASDPAARRVT